ncbi:phosphoglucomutase [Canibacter zhoujuaniae]|uniref:phosphoglucomutase n=1 Tax=Canibacter zhoujuaniae TaxID=2708343 RepID=UPI0014241B23|nr:phosphoglucomutase [Canibacter zhoujuaniae]
MSERAGNYATEADLVDLDELESAYFKLRPDPTLPAQRVSFGTSGHRGSSLSRSFNEAHIVAISQAIAEYRAAQGITGPLFIGIDTHFLSGPAFASAGQTLITAGVNLRISAGGSFTPTPALSHAVLKYNEVARLTGLGLADGVLITPSHNPPADGGIKYNPPHGGPADTTATKWIEQRANQLLAAGVVDHASLREIVPFAEKTGTVTQHDYAAEYIADLKHVIDMTAIRSSGLRFAAHPLGGAATGYWQAIAETYELNLTEIGPGIDQQWSFMTLDWDGKIRMDPSSLNAVKAVVDSASHADYTLTLANDADADRHGIIVGTELLNPNHFLAVAIDYLLTHRKGWHSATGAPLTVGKTVVSSGMIDRVVAAHGATLEEVPVGFKWFVPGLSAGTTVFCGEESAGASMLTFEGAPWSTDKDGIVLCLLAAEITAVTGKTPAQHYQELTERFGSPAYGRIDAPATAEQKSKLLALSAADIKTATLAGESITEILTHAPGNGAPIGGLVIKTADAWAAIRPSGTEAVMKIYAESFAGAEHLKRVQKEAQELLASALS